MENSSITGNGIRTVKMNKSGISALYTMIFILIFFVAFSVLTEYYRMFLLKESIEDELKRAASISMIGSISDRHRQDGILWMDTVLARDSFFDYIHNELSFDENFILKRDNKEALKIIFNSLIFIEEPPYIEIKGIITAPSFIKISNILGKNIIEIPFHIIVRDVSLVN